MVVYFTNQITMQQKLLNEWKASQIETQRKDLVRLHQMEHNKRVQQALENYNTHHAKIIHTK